MAEVKVFVGLDWAEAHHDVLIEARTVGSWARPRCPTAFWKFTSPHKFLDHRYELRSKPVHTGG